jgi:NADH:ubiquinone oxidoreductase subunit 6 (subunit J)
MGYLVLITGSIACAVLAILATRLLTSALWLAGVSVLTALMLYLIGAREVAVIELSVGAGLVTVLFVFAITIAGEDAMRSRSLVPKPLAWLLITLALLLLGFLVLPTGKPAITGAGTSFATTFWQERTLDVFAQIALIFAGVLGILGLLSEPKSRTPPSVIVKVLQPEAEPTDSDFIIEEEPQPEEELV